MPDSPHRRLDAAVDRLVDRCRNPAADVVFYSLSSAFDHSIGWIAMGAVRSATERDARPALRLAAVLGVESLTTNVAIKSLFRRVRPIEHDEEFDRDTAELPYGVRIPITSSFPSGHATAAFTAATLLAQGRRHPGPYYALAGLVAASRVYVRLHHASDVVAGSLLGIAMGRLARRVAPLNR
ncbi:MAG: phosphatase PAP2 family protein [Acidimicrobiia bacterium]|nr:phosphatase PAP2 family protein [Acidimicrobiia bacterium]